jgi:hypothetical protein
VAEPLDGVAPAAPAASGGGLRIPAYLSVVDPVAAGFPDEVTVVAVEGEDPAEPGRFRTNLVVTEQSTGGLGFRDWQAGTEELLGRVLPDYLVVDLERIDAGGRPGGRRLAHHVAPDGRALTMEQWFTLVDGVGHTLTATVETWRYDELADSLAAAAGSWWPAGKGE